MFNYQITRTIIFSKKFCFATLSFKKVHSWELRITGFLLWLADSRLEPRYHWRYTAAHQHVLGSLHPALAIYCFPSTCTQFLIPSQHSWYLCPSKLNCSTLHRTKCTVDMNQINNLIFLKFVVYTFRKSDHNILSVKRPSQEPQPPSFKI